MREKLVQEQDARGLQQQGLKARAGQGPWGKGPNSGLGAALRRRCRLS